METVVRHREEEVQTKRCECSRVEWVSLDADGARFSVDGKRWLGSISGKVSIFCWLNDFFYRWKKSLVLPKDPAQDVVKDASSFSEKDKQTFHRVLKLDEVNYDFDAASNWEKHAH